MLLRSSFPFTLLILVLVCGTLAALTRTLAWDPDLESPPAGYRLRYGTVSGTYTQAVDITVGTSVSVPNLQPSTTYYFVVVAFNAVNMESSPSNEVAFTSPSDPSLDTDADGLPDSWELANGFNPTDGGTGDISQGAQGDPDQDGLINFLEYVFDLNPREASRANLPAPTLVRDAGDGQLYLTLTLRKRLDHSRLQYALESSDDCKNWNPASYQEIGQPVPDPGGQTATVICRILPAVQSGPGKMFIRVAATVGSQAP